jgi:hypothetical protein
LANALVTRLGPAKAISEVATLSGRAKAIPDNVPLHCRETSNRPAVVTALETGV